MEGHMSMMGSFFNVFWRYVPAIDTLPQRVDKNKLIRHIIGQLEQPLRAKTEATPG
jgi:hypothetical protein